MFVLVSPVSGAASNENPASEETDFRFLSSATNNHKIKSNLCVPQSRFD